MQTMENDDGSRIRGLSVGSAFASLPKYSSTFVKRSNSTVTGLAPRSLRVVVLGVGGVGKTALTVRFVTKRFIGDYDPNLETIYRHTTLVDNQLVNFEIMDTAGQCENSLPLDDKCKWGESFVFVYDVTDRHSYDELTRLKFIATYTHSRLRVNFTPCWFLIGNKADLADRERMVSIEEGQSLARDLGCHIFREISVKESRVEASLVFEDLWRYFVRLSPRSPSSSQRRKYSLRIQDRISVIDSMSCGCEVDSLKDHNSTQKHQNMNEIFVRTITSSLRRHVSPGQVRGINYRRAKKYVAENQQYSSSNSIFSRIPENIKEDEEENPTSSTPALVQSSRRNAMTNHSFAQDSGRVSLRQKLSKSDRLAQLRSENSFNKLKSTSNSSLDRLSNSDAKSAVSENVARNRSNSDTSVIAQQSDTSPESSLPFMSNQLRNPRRIRNRPGHFNKARLTHSFRPGMQVVTGLTSSFEVSGY